LTVETVIRSGAAATCFVQLVDGAILPELPKAKVASTEPVLPIALGINLINEDGPMLTALARQIPLTITIDVEPSYHAPALNGHLLHRGVDRLALPHDVPRQTHVYRKQAIVFSSDTCDKAALLSFTHFGEAGLRRRQ
jgi:hypothetical protein